MLRQPALWAAGLGHFSANYSFYFVISWLPLFLVKSRGFSMSDMATLTGSIYLVYALSCIVTGWLGDRMIARRARAPAARVRASSVAGSGVAALAPCGRVRDQHRLGHHRQPCSSPGASFGLCSPNIFVVAQTLGGTPRLRALGGGAERARQYRRHARAR